MNYSQFSNLSCYEEFEMQCTLAGISKIDALKRIGHQINDYYFFISKDGFFNWFDLKGNHVEDPNVLKVLKEEYVPKNITKCIVPDSVKIIDIGAFSHCKSLASISMPNHITYIDEYVFYGCILLKEITIPDSVRCIGNWAFSHCKSLSSITIPKSVTYIGCNVFWSCSLKEFVFTNKTLKEVKQMENYPFGLVIKE